MPDRPTFDTHVEHLDPQHPAVTPLPYAEAAVRQIAAQAIGYGSVCWHDNADGRKFADDVIFDDQAALAGVEAAVEALLEVTALGRPHLGCATTGQLREELATREKLGAPWTDDDYRSVDDDA